MNKLFLCANNINAISEYFPYMSYNTLKQEMLDWDDREYYAMCSTRLSANMDNILCEMNYAFIDSLKQKHYRLQSQTNHYIGGIPYDESIQTHEDRMILDMMGPYKYQKSEPRKYDGWSHGMNKPIYTKYQNQNKMHMEISHTEHVEHTYDIDTNKPRRYINRSSGLAYNKK